MPNNPKPLIILISGAPGSGKSTFATLLGHEFGIPVVNRDELYRGLQLAGTAEVVPAGIDLFYQLLAECAKAGCSVIGDATLYRTQSESDVQSRLSGHGRIINIHLVAANAYDRFVARELADDSSTYPNDSARRRAMHRAREASTDLQLPLELGADVTITVRADDGFEPTVDHVATTLRSI